MRKNHGGNWYAKDEADAVLASQVERIAELEANLTFIESERDSVRGALTAARDILKAELERERARSRELEAERDALRVECDGWARERDEAVVERDAARAVLVSGHMGRVLWFVINHAGKGLHGALHDSVEWLEKKIAVVDKARSKE
jgi:multidrug resistance efflux pump